MTYRMIAHIETATAEINLPVELVDADSIQSRQAEIKAQYAVGDTVTFQVL